MNGGDYIKKWDKTLTKAVFSLEQERKLSKLRIWLDLHFWFGFNKKGRYEISLLGLGIAKTCLAKNGFMLMMLLDDLLRCYLLYFIFYACVSTDPMHCFNLPWCGDGLNKLSFYNLIWHIKNYAVVSNNRPWKDKRVLM